MSITISLPFETAEKLKQRAAADGVSPDTLARDLLEQALNGGGHVAAGRPVVHASWTKSLRALRQEIQEGGMTDEEELQGVLHRGA